MLDTAVTYPEGVVTTAEEREFDSFLLNYIIELAVKPHSPKVQLIPDELLKA